MRNSNRQFWHKVISSPIALFAALMLLIILGRAAWKMQKSATMANTKLVQMQAEADRLKVQEQDLTAKISYLSSPQGIEAELRDKYRAVREGEQVAVILGEPATSSAEGSGKESASSTPGFWQKVLEFIGF